MMEQEKRREDVLYCTVLSYADLYQKKMCGQVAEGSFPLTSCVDIFNHFLLYEAWHLRKEEYSNKDHYRDYGPDETGSSAYSRHQTSLTLT